MPFVKNADGLLDLYFLNERSFNLTMHLYAPQSSALTGR